MPPRPLILIHIPKTAGTTLSHMLRLHFGLRPANWFRHARTLGYYHLGYARAEHMQARLQRIADLSPGQRQQVRFFAAHAGYGIRDRLPDDMRGGAGYLAVLREPVARVISTFKHLRSEGRLAADATLRDYINLRKHFGLFKFDNCQTRYLAGERGVAVDVPVGAVTRDMLELARQRLERDIWFFGLTERFDETVLMLADRLNWSSPRYVSARVTRQREGEGAPDAGLLAEIRELNALDAALYEHASNLFQERVAAEGPEFAERLAQFARSSARRTAWFSPVAGALPVARRLLQGAGLLR